MFVLRPLTRSVALFAPKQANRACVICDAVTARWATSGPARPQRQQQSQPTQRDAPRKPAQAPASSGQHSKGQQRPQQQQSQSQQRDSGNRPPQTRTQSSGQPRTQNQQQNSSDTDGRKQKWLPQSAILEDIKTGSKNEELHPKLVAQVIGLRGEALGSLSIEKLKEMLPKLAAEREIPADDPYEKGTLPDMILVDRTQKPPVVKLKMPDTQEMIAARETAAAKAKEAQKHRATVVKEIELTTVIGTNDLKVKIERIRQFLSKNYQVQLSVERKPMKKGRAVSDLPREVEVENVWNKTIEMMTEMGLHFNVRQKRTEKRGRTVALILAKKAPVAGSNEAAEGEAVAEEDNAAKDQAPEAETRSERKDHQ